MTGSRGAIYTPRMTSEAAYDVVRRYLTQQFELPESKVSPQAHLFTDLELDSIDALDMISLLERDLGIDVVEEELKDLRIVEDVVRYIVRHAPDRG